MMLNRVGRYEFQSTGQHVLGFYTDRENVQGRGSHQIVPIGRIEPHGGKWLWELSDKSEANLVPTLEQAQEELATRYERIRQFRIANQERVEKVEQERGKHRQIVSRLGAELAIHPIAARALVNNGYTTPEEVDAAPLKDLSSISGVGVATMAHLRERREAK